MAYFLRSALGLMALRVVDGLTILHDPDLELVDASLPVPAAFSAFIDKYGRSYKEGTDEYEMRRDLFEQRYHEVRKINSRPNSLWKSGVNFFADHTEQELAGKRGYYPRNRLPMVSSLLSMTSRALVNSTSVLPLTWDWRSVLTSLQPIPEQGACGSCWAVAATKLLETHSELYQGKRSFSVNEIVSCSPNPDHCGGTGGCQGSTIELAMSYVMANGCSTKDRTCPTKLANFESLKAQGKAMPAHALGMTGWTQLAENKLLPVKEALVNRGPVGVHVAANSQWALYKSGIMDSCSTKDLIINHAVSLIGYGATSHSKYWILQNSWGADWGETGYLRLARLEDREEGDLCGYDNDPSKGTGCSGGPSKVWVCGSCGILYDTVVPHFELGSKGYLSKK